MNRGVYLSGRNSKYRPNGITHDERLKWARDAVRNAEVHALAKPHDRVLAAALEARRRELAALEQGRKR